MRILKQFSRWVLRDELRRDLQRRREHIDALVAVQSDLETFTRAVGPFMRLRGYCVNLALGKQEKPSFFYTVSRFDYWCLGFYWDVDMFMRGGWNPLWFRGIPIIWEGDSYGKNSFFRELARCEYPVSPTFNFPGSGNKPKDKTLKRSVCPDTGALKSSGCSRGQGRGEEEIPEAFFPWRE